MDGVQGRPGDKKQSWTLKKRGLIKPPRARAGARSTPRGSPQQTRGSPPATAKTDLRCSKVSGTHLQSHDPQVSGNRGLILKLTRTTYGSPRHRQKKSKNCKLLHLEMSLGDRQLASHTGRGLRLILSTTKTLERQRKPSHYIVGELLLFL